MLDLFGIEEAFSVFPVLMSDQFILASHEIDGNFITLNACINSSLCMCFLVYIICMCVVCACACERGKRYINCIPTANPCVHLFGLCSGLHAVHRLSFALSLL